MEGISKLCISMVIFGPQAQFWTARKIGFLNFPEAEMVDFPLTLLYLTRVQWRKNSEGGGVEAWMKWYGIPRNQYKQH